MTVTCADCGMTQTLPDLAPGAVAECRRCDRLLQRRRRGVDLPFACAAASFILLPPAVFLPLMHATIENLVFEQTRLVSSVGVIYSEVWFPFAFGFLFFAFLIPAIRALFLAVVLGSVRFGWRIWQEGRMFRWSEEMRIWSMPDVVVIAGAIAYVRAGIAADVELRIGAWCYMAVAILFLTMDRSLDRRAVWNAILPDHVGLPAPFMVSCSICELTVSRRAGDPCPRCGAQLMRRVPLLFAPVAAAVCAAIPLCIPAYSLAVMINDQLAAVLEHTIIGTVQLLADRGYWQFGVVVLIAGVVLPLAVLACMIWLLARVRLPERDGLVLRTRVYRQMRRLVRWPMIIPFIAAVAAPIVDFRGIDDIVAGPGATPLFAVITLLILAVRLFRPRLMWRTAGVIA